MPKNGSTTSLERRRCLHGLIGACLADVTACADASVVPKPENSIVRVTSPQLRQAISGLLDSLPNRRVFVFDGQEYNAMDNVPQQFAEVVGDFLLEGGHK